MSNAVEKLDAYAARHAKTKTAFESVGVPADWNQRLSNASEEAAKLCTGIMRRVAGQAAYNVFHNVPCQIVSAVSDIPKLSLRQALPGAIGAYVEWDIDAALELCVGILEDVNAHTEAAQVEAMRSVYR